MTFHVNRRRLPHDGIIPGARGHKKIVIPRGTPIYTIEYRASRGSLIYWAGYLDEPSALTVAKNLEAIIDPIHRRHIALQPLLDWNFKSYIPIRIHRPNTKHGNA